MLTRARLQSETISILITILSFGFLDLLRFALIQRASVFFWMHACPKNGGIFLLLPTAAKLFPGKNKSRAAHCCAALQLCSRSVLRQAKRLQGWLLNGRSNRQSIVGLEPRRSSPCLRSQASIDCSCVIALLSQRELHVFDDPIRCPIGIAGVNRSVIRIPAVRIVAPGRIPIAGVPLPPSA